MIATTGLHPITVFPSQNIGDRPPFRPSLEYLSSTTHRVLPASAQDVCGGRVGGQGKGGMGAKMRHVHCPGARGGSEGRTPGTCWRRVGTLARGGRQVGGRRTAGLVGRFRTETTCVGRIGDALFRPGRLQVASERLELLFADESHAVLLKHVPAPGDQLAGRQVALPEGLDETTLRHSSMSSAINPSSLIPTW